MPTEEEMQEKLKNMSPEELKEFQMQNCIFCQMVKGQIASKKIYEDDKSLAILDINPANPGHILLMPKEHYAIMPLIPEDIIKHLFMISKQLSAVLLKTLKAEGTNIFVANGQAAGQKAQHFMIHVFPRMDKDSVGMELVGKKASATDLEKLRKRLAEKVSKELGVKLEEDNLEESEEKSESVDIDNGSSKKQSVVDAEFVENEKTKGKKITTEKEEITKKKKTSESKNGSKKEADETDTKEYDKEKKTENGEDINLDDIANLIAGGN